MSDLDVSNLTDQQRDAMVFRVLGDREALIEPRSGVYLNQLVTTDKSHHTVGKALIAYLANPMCAIAPKKFEGVSQAMGKAASPFPALVKKAFGLYLYGLRQQMTLKSPVTITSGAWDVFDELERFTKAHKNTDFAQHVPWKKLKALAGPRMARDLYKDMVRFPALLSRIAQAKGIQIKALKTDTAIRALADGMVVTLSTSILPERKRPQPHVLRERLSRR